MEKHEIETGKYHNLGSMALVIFIIQFTLPTFGILLLSFVLFAFRPVFLQNLNSFSKVPESTVSAWDQGIVSFSLAGFGIFVICFCIGFLIAWLKYINYRYIFYETSLLIEQGILYKDIVSIPYRQVQNVNVQRSLFFRIFGISKVVILTAGHEDYNNTEGESEGIIPIIDKYQGEALRSMLLDRTHVQEVRGRN